MRIKKEEEPVPESYDDVFKQLEMKTKIEDKIKEAKERRKQEMKAPRPIQDHYDEDLDYDENEYYDEDIYGQEVAADAMQQLLLDPSSLQSVLQGMVSNPMMQAQLDPN